MCSQTVYGQYLIILLLFLFVQIVGATRSVWISMETALFRTWTKIFCSNVTCNIETVHTRRRSKTSIQGDIV